MRYRTDVAIDVCIETYGLVLHTLDSGWWDSSLISLRNRSRRHIKQPNTPSEVEQIRLAAASLPYEQTAALWLVDVCGYSYNEAAADMRVSVETVRDRVAMGRNAIRSEVSL